MPPPREREAMSSQNSDFVSVAAATGGARPLIDLAILLATFIALVTAGTAFAQSHQGYHSNPWLLSWIPRSCCVSNDCCWEITESELRPLDGDRWEVLATGQIVQRTDWAPDGRFYRCACDLSGGKWIKHQGAHTRCVFVPLRAAGL